MARIYTQSQRGTSGKWDSIVYSDDEGWSHAVGYCGAVEDGKDGGHDTQKDAAACYRRYCLEHEVKRWVSNDSQHKCRICGTWTQAIVEVGQCRLWHVCQPCDTPDNLAKLMSGDLTP